MATTTAPAPTDVWLDVTFQGTPPETVHTVANRLKRLRGWKSGFETPTSLTERYEHTPGRSESLLRAVNATLGKFNLTGTTCSTFIVWTATWTFKKPMRSATFGERARALESTEGILAVHSTDTQLNRLHPGMRLEFRGKPSPELLANARRLLRPYTR